MSRSFPIRTPMSVAVRTNESEVAESSASAAVGRVPSLPAEQQRRHAAAQEEEREEHGYASDRAARVHERVQVEAQAADDEVERDEEAEADGVDLRPEPRLLAPLVVAQVPEDDPGHERAEDRLQAEAARHGQEHAEEEHGQADPELRRSTFQRLHVVGEGGVPVEPPQAEPDDGRDGGEDHQEEDLAAEARVALAEEEGQQQDGAELGHGCDDEDGLTDARRREPRPPHDRDDRAQSGGRQDDRDEGRRHDDVGGAEQRPHGCGDREAHRVGDRGPPEHRTAQAAQLHLGAGREQEEREREHREDVERVVDLDPTQHVRSDDDAEHELEDDGRDPHLRDERGDDRRDEGDHEHAHEVHVRRHGGEPYSLSGRVAAVRESG